MSNISENPEWPESVSQIETSDSVLGGLDGKINEVTKQLADRTVYLKGQVEAAAQAAGEAGEKAENALQQVQEIGEAAGDAAANAQLALERMEGAQAAQALAEDAKRLAELAAGQTSDNLRLSNEAATRAGQKAAQADAAALASVQGAAISVDAKNYILGVEDEIRDAAAAVNESIAAAAASAEASQESAEEAERQADRAAQVVDGAIQTVAHAILSHPTFAEAEAAAATLPDGQEVLIASDENHSGRVTISTVQSGSLVFYGFAENASKSVLNAEWFLSGRTQQQALEAAFLATSGRVELNASFSVATINPVILARLKGEGSVTVGAQLVHAGDIPTSGHTINFPGVFADWRDLWAYLNNRRILGALTINVVSNYTFDGHWIEPRHPDGARVKVIGQGSATTKFAFTNLPSAAKAAGVKLSQGYQLGLVDKLTLDGDNWSGHSSGGPTIGAGNPDDPIGVLARDGGVVNLGNDVVVRRFARNGVLTFNGGHVFALPGVKVVECGSDGFVASTSGSTVVTGSTADGCYGFGYYCDYGGSLWCTSSASKNTVKRAGVGGSGFGVTFGGVMYAGNCVAESNAADGFVNIGGTLHVNDSKGGGVGKGNTACGFRGTAGGRTYADRFSAEANATGVDLRAGSCFFGEKLTATGNTSGGLYMNSGSTLDSNEAVFSANGGIGVNVERSCSVSLPNVSVDGNASHGINVTGLIVHIRTALSIKNNGGYGVQARYGGCVDLRSTNKATVITGNTLGAISATEVAGTGIPQSFVWLPA